MNIMFWKKSKKIVQIVFFSCVTMGFVSPVGLVENVINFSNPTKFFSNYIDPIYQLLFSDTFVAAKINKTKNSLKNTPGSFRNDYAGIKKVTAFSWLNYIYENTSKDSVFLVFRIAEFAYYAERPFIRDIEPKMKPFYLSKSKDEALKVLNELGISYLLIPKYAIPMVYRSYVPQIISDPEISELVFETIGMSIYRLNKEKVNFTFTPSEIFLTSNQEEISPMYFQARGDMANAKVEFKVGPQQDPKMLLLNNSKETLAYEIAAKWSPDRSVICLNKTDFLPSFLKFSAKAKGSGLLSFTLEYSAPPRMKRRDTKYLWESLLYAEESDINFLINFPEESCLHKLIISINADGEVELDQMKLDKVTKVE
jgi:hypothetical protein